MNSEIYDKAHQILAERRKKAQAENDLRISRINDEIPEIKEINDTLFSSGKKILGIIRNPKVKDINSAIERIKRENLGAQEMARSILVAHNYPADYLDIHYTCPYCKDTGYIESNFCECLKNLFGKLMTEQLNKNAHLELASFDTFSLRYYSGNEYFTMQKIFNYAQNYALNFTTNAENIFMSGDTGLGKTHLSLAIANVVIQKGFSVIYDSAMNILWNIEHEHFSRSNSSDVINAVFDADLLIIDDLGTENESKFNNAMVYNIINTRLVKHKPTIISTNLDLKAVSARYGGKVSSRLATLYKNMKFLGNDIRLQIFQENNRT